MIFTLLNCKMKDCQTVKYDWLVCEGAGEDCWIDLLGGTGGSWESLPDACTKVQRIGMLESLALGILGKVYCCKQPAGVQTQHLFPSFPLYFSIPPIL